MTTEHALIFVYGPGGNGKSVFLNILRHILQHYSAVAAMTTFMASQSDKHPTDVAMLDGSRLVTASETEEGHAWAESRIKQMTGGDPISARFMRQDFFTFQPQFKLTIVGNHKPALKNVDDAIRRRFLIVPFVRKPEKPDRELEQKLIQEAPSILGWMIEGCTEWQSKGLQPPESVMAATREYFGDQDLFAHWLEDECDTDKENIDMSMSSSEAFASWRDYCRSAGAQPGSAPSFKDKMTTEGFKFIKGRKSREFFGIRLKPKINYQV